MPKWEYQRHAAKINYAEASKGPDFFLNKWGADGWEVVGYSIVAEGYDTFEYILAKRPIT